MSVVLDTQSVGFCESGLRGLRHKSSSAPNTSCSLFLISLLLNWVSVNPFHRRGMWRLHQGNPFSDIRQIVPLLERGANWWSMSCSALNYSSD